MSLPLTWVDRIFDKLTLAYGRDFIGRWEGLPIGSVKTDWAHELSGFDKHPQAIKHALQSLPAAKPPTIFEFRNLCISAPRSAHLELPAPPADPVMVAAIANKIKLSAPSGPVDHKAWAKTLQARHAAGDRLNANQIRCMNIALGVTS